MGLKTPVEDELEELSETSEQPLKLLFICSRNRFRSLTAEKVFSGVREWQVRSAGTQPDARIVVTAGHIGWSDVIFCMEKSHIERLRLKYPEALTDKRVIALHIPDEYAFMQQELIDELEAKVSGYFNRLSYR